MLGRLFLLFTLVPLAELFLLIEVGEWIGAGPTVALVLTTGVVGAWLARREGTRSWRAVRRELADGTLPAEELLGAALVVLSGAFLVTPGILTDAVGLLLLARPVRSRVAGRIRRNLQTRLEEGAVRVFASGGAFGGTGGTGAHDANDGSEGEDAPEGWHRRETPESGRGDEEETGRRDGRRIIDV